MNKEELVVELENNYIQINIDDVRISYCNSLDKELVKAIYNLQQELNKKNKIIETIKENCISVIGNPEHTIVSKNKLMKILLEEIETLEKGSEE